MNKILAVLAVVGLFATVHAEETMTEKAEAKVHDVKRGVKKTANRVKEKLCAKSDVECLKQKASHRAEETSEYVKDKAVELKNNVDSEKK